VANTQINLNGFPMKIKDNGDSTYSTTSCSPVQELTAVNALAITDTANHDVVMDVSNLSGRKFLFINNTLNQSVTIQVGIVSGSGLWFMLGSKTVTTSNYGIISASDMPLLVEPMMKMAIRISCSVAPTSGTVSVWIAGVSA
jgi:hypothetical protein